MNDANNGSKLYLYSITTVAILGGLLFGYDTAVISGVLFPVSSLPAWDDAIR